MTIVHAWALERKEKQRHRETTNNSPRLFVCGCPCWIKVGDDRVPWRRRVVWVGLGENLGDWASRRSGEGIKCVWCDHRLENISDCEETAGRDSWLRGWQNAAWRRPGGGRGQRRALGSRGPQEGQQGAQYRGRGRQKHRGGEKAVLSGGKDVEHDYICPGSIQPSHGVSHSCFSARRGSSVQDVVYT